ncbi:MAG TPA: amidase [Armatimonadota bacterium]|jgi:aspartyl-tRNA(Asn)/glutamyl-tRNA(Gln) amidotransferase subunit A
MLAENAFNLGIPVLGRMLRSGKTSSLELTELALHRLQEHGTALNAVAALMRERAVAEARAADKELKSGHDRGPLHGIPYGAKDLLDARGAPTEWGSFAHKGRVREQDAAVIKRLHSAGAVLVAKLAMVSLAGGGSYRYASTSLTGPGRNPWNPGRWSGGSSSGSGAAVGGALVPFAIGSETWGSIVVPSSFCGVTGLRPTYGRVPRTGAMALSWTLDKLGPIARSANDASLVLAAIAGPDPADPSSVVGPFRHFARNRGPLRVGVLREDFSKGGDKAIENAYNHALKVLSGAGMALKDTVLPDRPYGTVAAALVTIEGSASFEGMITGPDLAKLNAPEQRAGFAAGLAMTGVDYLHAMRLREGCRNAIARVFNDFDVLVAPSLMDVAPPIDANLDTWFSGGGGLLQAAGNCVGIPCMSVPMGYAKDALPCGLQFCAGAGDERAMVEVARAFQQHTHWHKDLPTGLL